MAKSNSGKIIALIGGLLAVFAVLIGLLPSEISWWYVKETLTNQASYLNAFGFFTDAGGQIEFVDDYLLLVGGLVFLAGSVLIMYGASKKEKTIAILSGVLMIIGLIVFCVALNANENWEGVETFLSWLNTQSSVFYGEWFIWRWGLGIGFYLAAAGAVIGIIGAFVMD